MGVLSSIAKLLGTVGSQVTSNHGFWRYAPDKREIGFTNKCISELKNLGLKEDDVFDVYYNGLCPEEGKMVKKFNGYEVGIFYWVASDTGRIVITWVWKRERR